MVRRRPRGEEALSGFAAARWLIATAAACASAAAAACPLCLGAGQPTKAQQLVAAPQAVLAVPAAEAGRFRVVEVVKGDPPSGGAIEGGYPRTSSAAPPKAAMPLLLVREDPFPTWIVLGNVSAEHVALLRKFAAGRPAAAMTAEEWNARVVLVAPYLEHREPLLAELAYGTLAAAPYAAMRAAKPLVDASVVRRWLADPERTARQPLYLLLLGVAGNAKDAAALERRLEAARNSEDATALGSMLAADLELRGAARMAWVEEKYLRDRARSPAEIEAALLALSVHGNANGTIPRARVIRSYRIFMTEHPEIAGYVAQDLAAWQYWDAVSEYAALIKSDVRQQFPSRVAILAYLRESPSPEARAVAAQTRALPGAPR